MSINWVNVKNQHSKRLPIIMDLPEGEKWSMLDHDQWKRDKVYYSKVDAELTKEMLQFCDDGRENQTLSNTRDTLVGNIQEEYKLPSSPDNPLIGKVNEMLKRHLGTFLQRPVRTLHLNHLWVNYQKKGEYNPVHNHPGYFSFIWYLDIPDEIHKENYDLAMQEDVGTSLVSRGCVQFLPILNLNNPFLVLPNTNDFFMFTGCHKHTVYPFESDVTRVSISGNVETFFFEGDE
jgi:hypothetical protein